MKLNTINSVNFRGKLRFEDGKTIQAKDIIKIGLPNKESGVFPITYAPMYGSVEEYQISLRNSFHNQTENYETAYANFLTAYNAALNARPSAEIDVPNMCYEA